MCRQLQIGVLLLVKKCKNVIRPQDHSDLHERINNLSGFQYFVGGYIG
jgi:hypothetical protein